MGFSRRNRRDRNVGPFLISFTTLLSEPIMKNERRAIPDHPGYYADRTGRIWRKKGERWHLVRSTVNGTGYQYTHLKSEDSPWGSHLTQRLVCAAFKGDSTKEAPVCIRKAPRQQPRRVRSQRYLNWGDRSRIKRKRYVKLTCEEKLEVLRMWMSGWSQVDISSRFGVSQPAISYIVRGKTKVC